MPLQIGNWVANINGNVITSIGLQINSVDSQGAVTAAFLTSATSASAANGFWDEDSQKLTLFLGQSLVEGAEIFTGYLLTDSINLLGVTGSVIFTLAGFFECFQSKSPFVAAAAKRSVFGWYAQIGVD